MPPSTTKSSSKVPSSPQQGANQVFPTTSSRAAPTRTTPYREESFCDVIRRDPCNSLFKTLQSVGCVASCVLGILYICIAVRDSLHKDKPEDTVTTIASGFTTTELTAITYYGGFVFVSYASTLYRFREVPERSPHEHPISLHQTLDVDYASGDIYIADSPFSGASKIRRLNAHDDTVDDVVGGINVSAVSGRGAEISLRRISGLAVDLSGDVYVVDENATFDRLSKYSSTTKEVSTVIESSPLHWTGVLALDTLTDSIYLSQLTSVGLLRPRATSMTAIVGSTATGYVHGDAESAKFESITGLISVRKTELVGAKLFIADKGNHCIRAVDLDSLKVSTLAGRCTIVGNTDGTAGWATFLAPHAISVGSSRREIYAAEGGSIAPSVRKIVRRQD